MDQQEINKKIFGRLEKIEKALKMHSASSGPKGAERAGKETLSTVILDLRESGFFKTPKSATEVHKKLEGHYHCDLNRVAVALFRLRTKGKLRKTSKKENRKLVVAYVW